MVLTVLAGRLKPMQPDAIPTSVTSIATDPVTVLPNRADLPVCVAVIYVPMHAKMPGSYAAQATASDRSAVAGCTTVRGPPAAFCLTNRPVPPVALKSVVPLGHVIVPLVPAAYRIVREPAADAFCKANMPSAKVLVPINVWFPCKAAAVTVPAGTVRIVPSVPLNRIELSTCKALPAAILSVAAEPLFTIAKLLIPRERLSGPTIVIAPVFGLKAHWADL